MSRDNAYYQFYMNAPGNVTISQPYLLNQQCANCLVFNWDQPDEPFTFKKCKQCKVLEYCSESCQKEHWRLVHKKHCKNIANQRDEDGSGGDWPFSIYSHHPFSATKVPCDPVVALVMLSHIDCFRNEPQGGACLHRGDQPP